MRIHWNLHCAQVRVSRSKKLAPIQKGPDRDNLNQRCPSSHWFSCTFTTWPIANLITSIDAKVVFPSNQEILGNEHIACPGWMELYSCRQRSWCRPNVKPRMGKGKNILIHLLSFKDSVLLYMLNKCITSIILTFLPVHQQTALPTHLSSSFIPNVCN